MNYFNNINLNQNELQKAVMHPLATPPADPKQGQMYFNTGDKKLYYYDDTKWVALNDIDLSNYVTTTQLNNGLNNKLDKQTTTNSNTQVYAVTGNEQKMINATSAATGNTVVLRDANGKLQVAAGAVAADAVNKGQMDDAIAAAVEAGVSGCERTSNKVGTITDPGNDTQYPNTKAVVNYVKSQVSKVKDVTLDGTSIVNTETGVVALESTYSLTLDGTSGTLKPTEYDNLSGDDASYIWYTQTGVQPIRLTKVMSGEGSLQYQAVVSDTVMAVIIQSDKTWEFAQFNVEKEPYHFTYEWGTVLTAEQKAGIQNDPDCYFYATLNGVTVRYRRVAVEGNRYYFTSMHAYESDKVIDVGQVFVEITTGDDRIVSESIYAESLKNKTDVLNAQSTDNQYPTARAVVDYVTSKEPYHVELADSDSGGTLTPEQYNALLADKNSYILLENGPIFKLTRALTSADDAMQYTNVTGNITRYIGITAAGVWTFGSYDIETTSNKTTTLSASSTNTQYPSAAATYTYGQTVLTDAKSYTDTATKNVEKTTNKKTTIEGNGNATDYPSTSAVVGYAAPIAHAVAGTTYGVGTTQKYGHVKLVAGDMNGKANADGQVPSLNHTHSQYAELAGAAFTGNVTIGGNLTVNGTTTTIESTTLAVKDKLIEVASGNTVKLTTPAGLVVPKYDGTKNGALVFDGDGIAYVGDVTLNANGDIDVANSDLVALAGRAKTIAGGNLVKWDKATQTFVDAGIAASNLATVDDIPTASDYLTSTSDEQVISNGVNKKLGGSSDFKIRLVDTSAFKITDSTNSDNLLFSVVRGLNNMASPNRVYINAPLAIGSNTAAVGTAGQVLTSQGDGKAPQWTTLTIPQGTVKKFVKDFTGKNTDLEFSYEHKLGTNQCTVSLYKLNDSNNYEMVMADIILTTTNVIVKFAQAPTTTDSFRVVVTG